MKFIKVTGRMLKTNLRTLSQNCTFLNNVTCMEDALSEPFPRGASFVGLWYPPQPSFLDGTW